MKLPPAYLYTNHDNATLDDPQTSQFRSISPTIHQPHLQYAGQPSASSAESKMYEQWQEANNEKIQTKITQHVAKSVDPTQKARIDEKLAFAMFKTGMPFTAFEDDAWKDLFAEFGYKTPSPTLISTRLLDEAYEKMEKAVDLQLRASHTLNLVTDESTDISGHRIINTSVLTNNQDCFYISNVEAEVGKLGAEQITDQAIQTVTRITHRDLSKWASWTTDTCAVMRASWKRLAMILETAHVFTAGCDSHSIQLVIKDLLLYPTIEKHWKVALKLVNDIRNATKQLSFLWQEMERLYKGRRRVLVASVITRWGTQYNLVKSLDNCKEALRSFAYREDTEFNGNSTLLLMGFWATITQLLELLGPIHELQKMSEDNRATISYVYPRWMKLEAHLTRIANSNSSYAIDVKRYLTPIVEGETPTSYEKRTWARRRAKQLLPIHRVAYYLDPQNSKVAIPSTDLTEVEQYFKTHILEHMLAFKQFFEFRNHEGNFSDTAVAWGYKERPKMFWSCQETCSPALASFAKRLLTTIGNSVPSERAFSTMNYIHSKTRNKLSPERANKLQYIYMNSRTLAKQKFSMPTEDELLMLEEEYISHTKPSYVEE